jgi:putative transposase
MPWGLTRHQNKDHDHFITFSCYDRRPYLNTVATRDLFEQSLERTRKRYQFEILAYVIMPEHVHLLVTEPKTKPLSTALQSLKLSVSKLSSQKPFWHDRYYDFNVFTNRKQTEKIKYIHRNPVTRGLVERPEEWSHSSYLTYLHRQQRTVQITL